MGDTLNTEELTRIAVCGGAQDALRTLLDYWTDDNDCNRKMAEDLLGLAIVRGEGLEL